MPLYALRCSVCGLSFEARLPMEQRRDGKCPDCGAAAEIMPSIPMVRWFPSERRYTRADKAGFQSIEYQPVHEKKLY